MSVNCLTDEPVLAYLDGSLQPNELKAIEAHLAVCPSCCTLLAETAKLLDDAGDRTLVASRAPGFDDAPRPPLEAGTRLGRYRIEHVIGSGGMGVVYAAHDPELHRSVAIKVLRTDLANDHAQASKERLLREARAMARLSHPNVVSIYDVGLWNDEVFVAMELVVGRTLHAWLREEKPEWEGVVGIFLGAGSGLVAAHQAGLVHRDFKPANVLVGADGRARVTDFGLARTAGVHGGDGDSAPRNKDSLSTFSVSDDVCGTPAYMSPEQLEGAPVDARTDEYSFCVALYEGLYGARPSDDAPVPTSPVPAGLTAVVLRGLSARPADRFPTLADLLFALRAAVEDAAPPHREKATRGRRASALAPRRRFVAAAGVLLCAIAIVGSYRWSSSSTRTSAAIETPAPVEHPSLAAVADAPSQATATYPPSPVRPNVSASKHPSERKPKAAGSKRVQPIGDRVENPF